MDEKDLQDMALKTLIDRRNTVVSYVDHVATTNCVRSSDRNFSLFRPELLVSR